MFHWVNALIFMLFPECTNQTSALKKNEIGWLLDLQD